MSAIAGFDEAIALVGFMTPPQFQVYRDLQLPNMTGTGRRQLKRLYESARMARLDLPGVDLEAAEQGPLESDLVSSLEAQPIFQTSFGSMNYHFAWVDPAVVVSQQAFVKVRARPAITSANLLSIAFPAPAQPDFDVESGGNGTFYLVSSSPHIMSAQPRPRPEGDLPGLMTVTVPAHVNFIQVANVGGMYLLRNGTHRLYDSVRTGVTSVPALVIEARSAEAAYVNLGIEGFELRSLMGSSRPPLVSDFLGAAAIPMPMRRSRYGWTVRFS
jgi:hypothetical protein